MRFFGSLVLVVFLLSGCSDGAQQRLQLEELERMNRADSVMTNDSLARDLADWFDHHGSPNEQLRAYYILGRTYADRGELPQAVNAYNDALGRADTTSQNCDYRTLSRVHAQTAQLYYCQLLPDNMILHERLAMKYAQMANDTIGYIACYAMLGEGYDMKNVQDSALCIFTNASLLYINMGESQRAAALYCSIADIYRKQKDFVQAKKYMYMFETASGLFLENGCIEPGREMYYSCKGNLCLDTSDKANAEYYFRKLLDVANNYSLKCAALVGLRQFYTVNYDKDSLIRYTNLCDSLTNIVHIEAGMQKTLQVQAMYDYTRSELVASQKERETERFKTTLIVVCSLFVIFALLFSIIYVRSKDEKRQLEDRILLMRGYAINRNLYDSPIAIHFRQLLKEVPSRYPDLKDWKELTALIVREVPDFFEKLNGGTRQLTDFELDVCMLIKIQITSSDIARLKQCTPSYITQIRKNIYQNLFMKKGRANELDEYIMSLS